MTTTASSGPTIGAQTTNRIDDTATADRPASWSMPAPRIGRVVARARPDQPDPARPLQTLGRRVDLLSDLFEVSR